MAGKILTISTPIAGVALASGSNVSVLQVTNAANAPVKLLGVSFGLHGISTTDPSVAWGINLITTPGVTGSGAVTPRNVGNTPDAALCTAIQGPWTTEPVINYQEFISAVQPELGATVYFPFAKELTFAGGAVWAFFCKVLSGAANSVFATLHVEE